MASIHVNKNDLVRFSETLGAFLEKTADSNQSAQVSQAWLPSGIMPEGLAGKPDDSLAHATTSIDSYTVLKVVDGDTLTLMKEASSTPAESERAGLVQGIAGVQEKITVRLIGLNTPESVDPRKPVECFAKEASAFLKENLEGHSVTIEHDSTQGAKDRYGRELAYVYRDDGLLMNLFMIEEGYGYEYTYGKPYMHQAKFKQAQAYAQYHQNGLWAEGACDKI